ncbi:hypothetical protein N7462_007941 [Penicillium macrosclerotiorum]|uniref:uncharacterized protein n=1 Tax=Penicillium macrosclerotiorum TaxID=303699 RepID=UPI0025485034|nr:uncharacterized protein N7462_007941 [Penicillium macrosclerotiorum]KAJ5679697.1 hypothetical protein N7462_007941 [Penicillium macrosclerotiorum]
MRRLAQALVALFVACGAHAEFQGPDHCLGELHDSSQARSVAEVVVWVNEDGDLLSTETTHATVTPALVGNSATTIPTHLSKLTSESAMSLATPMPSQSDLLEDNTSPNKSPSADRLQKKPQPNAHHPHPDQPPHPDHHEDQQRRFGISYSPYNADRSCKTQAEVNKDLDKLSGYAFVRIYGTDCDQTKTVAIAARQHKMQVFAGVYDLTDFPASLKAFNEAATLPDGTKDWSVFHTIAIGNELVNGGISSPAEVTGAVNQARTALRAQGYRGPVVTVDTFSVLLKHPELCHASDYCAANCHAFFDANQQPHDAGPYALEQAHAVSQVAGGKRTIITESGWPHAGQANGAAVPSEENQRVAIESIRRSFAHRGDDLVLFTAFDDLWKQDNRYTFSAERFWGIYQR